MTDLASLNIKYLPGVGPKRAELLNKELEIFTYLDLLHYYPYKYIDRSKTYKINEIDGSMPYIQLRGKSFHTPLTEKGHAGGSPLCSPTVRES